jgi:transcriptional regulator with PAS, ATPase and Fis domain
MRCGGSPALSPGRGATECLPRSPQHKMRTRSKFPLLVQCFLKKYNDAYGKNIAGLMRRAQAVMLQHAWPGNVRELENVISSARITTMADFIDIADLPEQLQHRGTGVGSRDDWRPLSMDEVRKQHIQRVLGMCKGNRLRAAQVLGIGRTSLYRDLKEDGYGQAALARAKTAGR